MGKPVIASDFESSREIVDQYKTGILFKPNDHKKLADAMISILKKIELTNTMGETAHGLARELFNYDLNLKKVHTIYNELIK